MRFAICLSEFAFLTLAINTLPVHSLRAALIGILPLCRRAALSIPTLTHERHLHSCAM
jgi:hypothetical protein